MILLYVAISIPFIIALFSLLKDWNDEKRRIYISLLILTICAFMVSCLCTYFSGRESEELKKENYLKDRRQITLTLLCSNRLPLKRPLSKIEKNLRANNYDSAIAFAEAILLYANTLADGERQQVVRDIYIYFIYNAEDRREKIKLLELINIEYPEEFAEVHRLLGQLYAEEGRFKDAMLILNKALYIEDDNSITYHLLGRVSFAEGDWEKALKYYKRGIEKNEKYVNLNIEIGDIIWCYTNDVEKAKGYYEKAIENKDIKDWYYSAYEEDLIKRQSVVSNKDLQYNIKPADKITFFLKETPFVVEESKK
ncbi:MAG: tetratricopeptide repeat protein [Candidatus Omnitrophica bacterium]|nr:tetratricopeptide repeat protein [Candidatus Omnitrophota bacterium]